MAIRLLASADDLQRYDAWISSHPQGNLWQSLGWKTHQEALGRTVKIYADEEAGKIAATALVVIDKTTGGLSTWEIPRGPLGIPNYELRISNLIQTIIRDAKKQGALSLYLSPIEPIRNSQLGIRNSGRHTHPEATRILDLTLDEEALLAGMKQKGRYNIRLAEKNGVTVKPSDDVDAFAVLMDETAKRDGFRSSGSRIYRSFLQNVPGSFLLLAYASADGDQGKSACTPVAGLIGAIWGNTGIYYYGASDHTQRDLMAPYLLQWEAMKKCKTAGCTSYDLFGIAPTESLENVRRPALPAQSTSLPEREPVRENPEDSLSRNKHPWAGVSEFKAKFGGTVATYPPEQEIVLRPMMKKLLQLKRTILG